MLRFFMKALVPVFGIPVLAGCSSDGSLTGNSLTTSSINASQAAKPAVDPICVTLVSKIDSLRKDGITSRVAKAGAGKSKTVPVLRKSLARMAELDRANAEFQQRCATLKPATAAAAAAAPPTPATVKKVASDKPAKKTTTAAVKKPAASPVKTVAKAQSSEPAKKEAELNKEAEKKPESEDAAKTAAAQ